MNIQYTIIIPHYNLPDLLERLLNSIPKRKDVQVIVVDDCSTFSHLMDLSKLQFSFSDVEFYSTAVNGGGGKARNVGLEYAKGKYVIFADADDFFTPEFSEILSTYQNTEEYDIIYFNNTSVDSDTLLPSNRNNQLSSFFKIANKDSERALLALRYIFGEPWCKIVKRELIEMNGIRFDETPIHNDTKYSYLVGYYGNRIKLDDRIGYCITSRSESVSKQISNEKLLIRTQIFSDKMKFLKSNAIPLIDPLVFTPTIKALKSANISFLKKVLKVMKESGYSKYSFLRDYLRFRKKGYFID